MKNPAGRGEPDDNEQSPMLSVLERCCSGSPGLYLFGDQQPVRVLDGRALVQQQGLELPLLNVIESVKHNSQKLGRQERKKKCCFDPYTLQGFREARRGTACSRNADGRGMELVRSQWHERSHKGIHRLTALIHFLEEVQMFLASQHLLVDFKSYG